MVFNRFNIWLVVRLLLILLTGGVLIWMYPQSDLFFSKLSTVGLLLVQIYEFIWYVNRTNRELTKFLYAVKYEDYSTQFKDPGLGKSFGDLNEAFNSILEKLRSGRIDKESQFQLFQLVLEKINIGIITKTADGRIDIMNRSAQEMLNSPKIAKWDRLCARQPMLTSAVDELTFGGKKLISIETAEGLSELSLDVNPIRTGQVLNYIITFQDIKDEIEQKEIEAWHKLIRILTHEIMNSVTPITSLTDTMKGLLLNEEGEPISHNALDDESIEDIILALNTIHRRSVNLMEFVSDYRRLTKIPAPEFELVRVYELCNDVMALMKTEFDKRKIHLELQCPNKNLAIRADRKLIEQVIINLITNSFHALQDTPEPKIWIHTEVTDKRIAIKISDNGPGVERDKLERIFIPFYSTKSDGTGIGLSLSRNILRQHQGNLTVYSKPGEETSFTLSFPNHAVITQTIYEDTENGL